MPTEIPVFDSGTRCLWLSRTPKGPVLKFQDAHWASDVFGVTADALRALSVGFADLEASNDSGRLRLRWSGDRLMLEYDSASRVRVEEVDVVALLAAIDAECE